MTDDRIQKALSDTQLLIESYGHGLDIQTREIRKSIRLSGKGLSEVVSLNIAHLEGRLIRALALIYQDAEYHLLKAYYSASPALIAFVLAALKVVTTIISAIKVANDILYAITGHTLASIIDELVPGFEDWWRDLMNKISTLSSQLGWGVDGIGHLVNAFNIGADTWGTIIGKERNSVKIEKAARTQDFLDNISAKLSQWQANPGEMLAGIVDEVAVVPLYEEWASMYNIRDKIAYHSGKIQDVITGVGSISNEILALQEGMPAFIAANIPQGVWDGITAVDSAINDRILPAITNINDRLDELDAVLESYRLKASELADRLAHPGDLMAEIDKLPDYVRSDQLAKIDDITSRLMSETNAPEYALAETDFKSFELITEILSYVPAPVPFMELELPARAPGIVAEPRETWFVGDY